MYNKEEAEYAAIWHLACALGAMCAAPPEMVIEQLTGWLWDEEEAGSIKRMALRTNPNE